MVAKWKICMGSAAVLLALQMAAAQTKPASGPVASGTVPAEVQRHIDKVTSCLAAGVQLKGEAAACKTLAAQMATLHVPGVSIAVIHNGVIEWAEGFGVTQVGGAPVNANTLFQAGSISKPLSAMAALREVQDKKLMLDADVNTELTSWKVPPSAVANGKPVTLRELLTHTAGFTVHGFPGYAAGDPVPTLVQVLNGEKPANTPAIRLESEPGSKFNYSGGGYVVMEQVLLDTAKEPFPKLMHDTVLAPIGMTHSTYEQPLPVPMQANAAVPYNANGTAIKGGAHTYPEMTAAGLWTTPTDLARYCMEVQLSLQGKANHVLSQEMTRQMVARGMGDWGLGVQIGGSTTDPYFGHGGVNEGFESEMIAYQHHGDGAVIMTNAQGGTRLAEQIMASIATEYGWPDFKTVAHEEVKVAPDVLAAYPGVYQLQPGVTMTITMDGDQLQSQLTGQPKVAIYPEADGRFFLKVVEAELVFEKDPAGKVTGVVLHQNGQQMHLKRLDDAEGKRLTDEAAAKDALAAKRFAEQTPAPGSEAALRRDIAGVQAGKPNYDEMSAGLADATRQQLTAIAALFAKFGAVQSVTFGGVARNGADVYTVEFEHGKTEWRITMAADGKIDGVNFRQVQGP
jgi:CubicO group peptidase (beta-lactamase class C family)